MTGITISKALRTKLPEDQREGLEEYLWAKSAGKCSLCELSMNPAADIIEADHDVAVAEGGADDRDNLKLAHLSCNRAKKNNPSLDVRPYLKLKAYANLKANVIRYNDCAEHFGISVGPSEIETISDQQIRFHFCDGTTRDATIFEDSWPKGKAWRYVYVDAPSCAIHNDFDCQPRTIKLGQAWSIFVDLQQNPLHEPPSCRIIVDTNGQKQLSMFDGQHKTIAALMRGAERVTVKVYLNLSKDEAIRLVNSIQSKIKKLPLSPFEISAKMSDEWAAKLAEYEEAVGSEEASEAGFVSWIPALDRKRGKAAFQAALVQDLLSSPDLTILKFVKRAGQPDTDVSLITENSCREKLLKKLLQVKPLTAKGDEGQTLRNRERENILQALNMLNEIVFEPQGAGVPLSAEEAERRRRMVYQSSLAYIAFLIRSIYRHELTLGDQEVAMLEKQPTEAQSQRIRQAIERLASHPVWSTKFEHSPKMKAVQDALSKNQDAKTALDAVGLKLGYLVGADELSNDWFK
jgi:hypothetical protein